MKLSIITTIYKAEKDLPRLLDSMMAQKAPELEFFLIDNGSPDRCGEICREYAAKDPRFTIYTLEENIGYIRARNLGIEVCDGDYIGFCDSDDYLEPGGYDRAVERIRETDCDFYIASYFQNNGDREQLCAPPYAPGVYRTREELDIIAVQAFGNMPGKPILPGFVWKQVYRRSILMDHCIRFPLNLMPYEDEVLNVDVIRRCGCIVCDNNPIYHYVVNEASITMKLVANFDGKKSWELVEELYRQKMAMTVTPAHREAVCNEALQMIYEYILVLCKQPLSAKQMTKLFRSSTDRSFIRQVFDGSSAQQPRTLRIVRMFLRRDQAFVLLGAVRLALKQKYR